jgi:hypothetical protein
VGAAIVGCAGSVFAFLLVMLVVTLMAFERLAFTEWFAEKDKTIEELRGRT